MVNFFNCFKKIPNFSKFIILCTIIFGILSFCTLLFFSFYKLIITIIFWGWHILSSILLFICTIMLIKNMYNPIKNYEAFNKTYSVPMSTKLFIFALTIINIFVNLIWVPCVYVINHIKPTHSHIWFIFLIETIYLIAAILYFIVQFLYLWFYLSVYGFFESESQCYQKYIFGFTLIINFWQHWLQATLAAKVKICTELIVRNEKPCIGYQSYFAGFTMPSEVEKQAIQLFRGLVPLSYVCAMNIFAVYLIILCFCKSAKRQQIIEPFFILTKIFQNRNKKRNLLLSAMLFLIFIKILCLTQALIISLYDKVHPRATEKRVYFWLNGISVIFEFIISIVFCWIYKIFRRKNRNAGEKTAVLNAVKSIFSCLQKSDPKMFFLLSVQWIQLFSLIKNIIFDIINLFFNDFQSADFIFLRTLLNIVSTITSFLNFKLLCQFFMDDSKNMFRHSNNDNFTINYMIPFQIITYFYIALNRQIRFLNGETFSYLNENMDQKFTIFSAAYPFSPFMNIISALCWAEIFESFIATKNLYNFITNQKRCKKRQSL